MTKIYYKKLKRYKTKKCLVYNFNNPFHDTKFVIKEELKLLKVGTLINVVIGLDPLNKSKDKHWYIAKGIVIDNTEKYLEIEYNDFWETKTKNRIKMTYSRTTLNGRHAKYGKERIDYSIFL